MRACPRKWAYSHDNNKKMKMKKNYFSPKIEVIEAELESEILLSSGGGINDDGSVNTGSEGSTNPSEDYGW